MTRLPTFDSGSHLIYSDPVVMSAVRSLNKIRRVSGDMKEVCSVYLIMLHHWEGLTLQISQMSQSSSSDLDSIPLL